MFLTWEVFLTIDFAFNVKINVDIWDLEVTQNRDDVWRSDLN